MFQINKWYSTQELVNILGIKDGKNFSRDCKKALDSMGVKYEYNRKKVKVLELPDLTEQKIKNILKLRGFKVDNIKEFAVFFYCLLNLPEYQCMPWEARAELIKENWGIDVDPRRIQNWALKLKNLGVLRQDVLGEKTVWRSYWFDGKHYQEEVTDPAELVTAKEFWKDFFNLQQTVNLQEFSCNRAQSQFIAKKLYSKYQCWYFNCNSIWSCAWDEAEDLHELKVLVNKYVEENF